MDGCARKEIDVFMTDDAQTDEFIGSVWSVEMQGDTDAQAVIVNADSVWVTWSYISSPAPTLQVGDVVRIGTAQTGKWSGLTTVLEVKAFTHIANHVFSNGTPLAMKLEGDDLDVTLAAPSITSVDSAANYLRVTSTIGGDRARQGYAYRLSEAFNCTLIGPTVTPYALEGIADSARESAQLTQRHRLKHSLTLPAAEQRFFPLYRVHRHSDTILRVRFTHSVRKVHWIKLCGYSMFDKRRQPFHVRNAESVNDDWVAVFVKDVRGQILSNNTAANGAFAILHTGGSRDMQSGGVEYHTHDACGIFEADVDSLARGLEVTMRDSLGAPAHFGRIHLWFKLSVTHA